MINDTGRFIHLSVSSSIILISGLKFKCTSSDSWGEIITPGYLMVSVERGMGVGRVARFQLFFKEMQQ